jgi:pyruvate ferredoxin oxidoreductase beta subunit
MAGVEAAYKALKKEGMKREVRFIAFAGDGATYDIGLQAFSGMLERGHDILYVCYDNEGYMNTGNQRSGATPHGANTTTQPAGKGSYGKTQQRKNIMEIVAAHNIPYAAQASTADIPDLMRKAKKALEMKGPRFLNVLSPCITNWKYDPKDTVNVAKLAVETMFWPLYEVESGKYTINYEPKQKVPIEEFLKLQKRFAHLFKPENRHAIAELQANIDREWERLKKRI